MSEIYKTALKPEDHLNFTRAVRLERGDRIYLIGNHNIKVGHQYENYPAVVSRIYYKHRKWWWFWKKREMMGCEVLWLGDEQAYRG